MNHFITVPLTSRKYPGLVALVDADDAPKVVGRVWNVRRYNNTYYAFTWYIADGRRRRTHMHEIIAGYPRPDHKDRDGLNNRKSNLRPATPLQQRHNTGLSSNNTSGYKGVAPRPGRRRWTVRIKAQDRRINLGDYATPEQAAKMYDAAAVLLFGEYAATNSDSIDPAALVAVVARLKQQGVTP